LPELIVYLVLVSLVAAVAVPALSAMRASASTAAAVRHLVVAMQALRWNSVAQGRGHGLRFVEDADGIGWYVVRDGNGNGLRSAEVRDGTDETLTGPHRLADIAPGIAFGFPVVATLPEVPPRSGRIEDRSDPIRIGNSSLLSFGPLGTATGGTLYVTDGHERLYAIVIYGRTAKIRVWRFSSTSGKWNS